MKRVLLYVVLLVVVWLGGVWVMSLSFHQGFFERFWHKTLFIVVSFSTVALPCIPIVMWANAESKAMDERHQTRMKQLRSRSK